MKFWWICPNCNNIVNFEEELSTVFAQDGEAEFNPEHGMYYHSIWCGFCEAEWNMNIGKMHVDRMADDEKKS